MLFKIFHLIFLLILIQGCGSNTPESKSSNKHFNFIDNLDTAIIVKENESYNSNLKFIPVNPVSQNLGGIKKNPSPGLSPSSKTPQLMNGVVSIDFKFNDNSLKEDNETSLRDKKTHFDNVMQLMKNRPVPVKHQNWKSIKGKWEINENRIKVPLISEIKYTYPSRSNYKSTIMLNPEILINRVKPFSDGYIAANFKFGTERKKHFKVIRNNETRLIDPKFNNSIGICFRMTDDGTGYVLLISIRGDIAIAGMDNGLISSILTSFKRSKIFKNIFDPDISHSVNLFIDGKSLSIYFDDSKTISNLGNVLTQKNKSGYIGIVNGFGEETILNYLAYSPSTKKTVDSKDNNLLSLSEPDHSAGLLFRSKEKKEDYLVELSGDGSLSFGKRGEKVKKTKSLPESLDKEKWHNLKAVFIGNQIAILVDNRMEMLFDDLETKHPVTIEAINKDSTELRNFEYAALGGKWNLKKTIKQVQDNAYISSFLEESRDTGRESASTKMPVQIKRVKIDGDTRDALLAIPPSSIKYTLLIPSNAYLNFAYSIKPHEGKRTDGVSFEIIMEAEGGKRTTIFSRHVGQRDGSAGWFEENIDLAQFSNQKVNILFETMKIENSSSKKASIDEFTSFALWGEPSIYTRRAEDQLNVILISIDTLRADRLGSYGYFRNTSPNIDSFGKEGVLFKNVISQAPYTTPSHISLFTSLYPSSFGFRQSDYISNNLSLGNSYNTLAETLRENGFITAAFTGGGFVSADYGFSQGFSFYNEKWKDLDDAYTNTTKWLESHKSDKFFLFFHTYEVHDYAPGEHEIYAKDINPLDKVAYSNALYDGNIKFADNYIGLLLQKLKDLEISDKTLIIITSDHGEEFWDHGLATHGHILYDEMIRVPLLIRLPGVIPENRIVNSQVRLIDVFPTVLDLLKIYDNSFIEGKSLAPYFYKNSPKDLVAFSEGTRGFPKKSIRTGKHKYIYWLKGDELDKSILSHKHLPSSILIEKGELYDLTRDPKELRNIANEETELSTDLRQEVINFMQHNNEVFSNLSKDSNKDLKIDKETEKRLRALGYIQ